MFNQGGMGHSGRVGTCLLTRERQFGYMSRFALVTLISLTGETLYDSRSEDSDVFLTIVCSIG